MSLFEGNKVIDEARQGEVTMQKSPTKNSGRKLYLESYGCQMNFSDSEIVASILSKEGFTTTTQVDEADVILLNTCSIRDNAEQRVRNRLKQFKVAKANKPELIVGMLGCMAERLKSQLLEEEQLVDLIAGPDAYRALPDLIQQVDDGQRAVNVLLSQEETYADISPVRLSSNGVTAFISIMRGCDNMCSFCVVPFTRGRERSRNVQSIIDEAQDLVDKGYREVTLLGQNVDSYLWSGGGPKKDFENQSEHDQKNSINFAQLLEKAAQVNPDLRIRFSTSHPKDMTDDVLHVMAKYENICNNIHLPVQSGSSEILEKMNRGYTREWYLKRIAAIRNIMPDCGISTDIITGFCSETDEQHQETISLMKKVKYDFAYMFNYSERPKTQAERQFTDDVPSKLKTKRLQQIIGLQQLASLERNNQRIGKTYKVLIEGTSKKSEDHLFGRTSQNVVAVFPKGDRKPGQYVAVKVNDCTSATLLGKIIS